MLTETSGAGAPFPHCAAHGASGGPRLPPEEFSVYVALIRTFPEEDCCGEREIDRLCLDSVCVCCCRIAQTMFSLGFMYATLILLGFY